jgi:hypothetical protein
MERVAGGLEDWAEGDDTYHGARTAGAEDGYLPAEVSW